MTIFHQYEEKPLTLKRKLQIWAMLYVLVPAFAALYGYSERINAHWAEVERINSQPIEVALPEQLPNIYDF